VSPSAVARRAMAFAIGAVANRNIPSRRSNVRTSNANETDEFMQFSAHPSKESVSDALTKQIKFPHFSHSGPFVDRDGRPPTPRRRATSNVTRATSSTRGFRARTLRNQRRNLTDASAGITPRHISTRVRNVEYVRRGHRAGPACFEKARDT
jgi:hypothetical protein